MTYEKGKEVIVKNTQGDYLKGTIDDYVFDCSSYWVNISGTFMLFSTSDLDGWNVSCVCGSDAVSHPGHAYYCFKVAVR